jgi:integrase
MHKTPAAANRCLALLSHMFTKAELWGVIPEQVNPCRRIDRYRERNRERFLTTEELRRLGAALREAETIGVPWDIDETKSTAKHIPKNVSRRTLVSPYATAAIRLLLFTGARLREILGLKWEWVDLERGLLLLPDSKTGKKTIILPSAAVSIIRALPRSGQYVIAGNDPTSPRTDLKRPWVVIAKRAQLTGVRLHDLRHSFASVGAGAGLGLPIIGKLLGHAQAQTTQRYAHLDTDPIKRSVEFIADHIASAMGDLQSLVEA